jgi:hypothetical protein
MNRFHSIKRVAQTGAAAAVIVLALGSASAFAAAQIRGQDLPTAQGTVGDPDTSVMLVHTQSMQNHTVCADAQGTTDVNLTYDDNSTTLSPGNCVHVEASQISATGSGDGTTHVRVHNHGGPHGEVTPGEM